MKKLITTLIAIIFFQLVYPQVDTFIPMDNETLEFIAKVNYNLFKNKELVYSDLTSKYSVTRIPKNIEYDSIFFSKEYYESIGFKKNQFKEVIFLNKTILQLDEHIITNKKSDEIILGEKARFVRRHSKRFMTGTNYGLVFPSYLFDNRKIDKISFYVNKVKYKTNYKIKLYAVEEVGDLLTYQSLRFIDTLFESPVLTLEKGAKNKIEINLAQYDIKNIDSSISVSIELVDYRDENNEVLSPRIKNQTKLKYQLSKDLNYYEKTVDLYTKQESDYMININLMINKDFAELFFKKPHKSILVSPAILIHLKDLSVFKK